MCLLQKEPQPGSGQEPQQELLRIPGMREEAPGRCWVLELQQLLVVGVPAGLSPVRDSLGTSAHGRHCCHQPTQPPCAHLPQHWHRCHPAAGKATSSALLPPARGQLRVQGGSRMAQLGPPKFVRSWQLQCSPRCSLSPSAPRRCSLVLCALIPGQDCRVTMPAL